MPENASPPINRFRATILFVEDDDLIREMLRTELQKARFQVLTATNATDGKLLAASHEGEIHLLISDLKLPGGSGVLVADKFHALHPQAEVLFISGCGSGDLDSHRVNPQQVFLLPKPFSVSDFCSNVESILERVLTD